MTVAKGKFESHISQCADAITIHEFLEGNGYSADFGLRFVWVASVSALDYYITELILEKATEHFSNGASLTAKLLSEGVPFAFVMNMRTASPAQAVVEFREIMSNAVRFRTFQKADDVADGLAYVWSEKHKWDKIAAHVGVQTKSAKRKLNGICTRRDLIVHNADYNEATGDLTPCVRSDAEEVVNYVASIVAAIDDLVS
jgi:hypothetical protein